MRSFLGIIAVLVLGGAIVRGESDNPPPKPSVYILPIREDISPPLVYLVRRGVKEAMEAKADLLVLDMETNGGRVDVTEEIIGILGQFKGKTATYVNRKAFSAGAFIAVATQKIYMSPQSVIGAAAPIIMTPGGGVEKPSETLDAKMTSGVSALVRASAEKNGHNTDVVEAMIDKNKELKMDGQLLNEKGRILTLTNQEAERKYGQPPKPLLSLGTFETLDSLLADLGYGSGLKVRVAPTGAERLAFWINFISPVLLIIGMVGLYIEFKTPGFGFPGVVGILAFALYFLGGYVGGLAGLEWAAFFLLGLALLVAEFFFLPGTLFLGFLGVMLMIASILMAGVDIYPGMPAWPGLPQLRVPLTEFAVAVIGTGVIAWLLRLWLPNTIFYHTLVSQAASGVESIAAQAQMQAAQKGWVGTALSTLRPSGKAQFGEEIIDVITQGELLEKGRRVKIIGHSANSAIVEESD
jgi:membrane-bound serine protease (ClpP class)